MARNSVTRVLFCFFTVMVCLGKASETEALLDYSANQMENVWNQARAFRNITEDVSEEAPTISKPNATEVEQDEIVENTRPLIGGFPDDVTEHPAIFKHKLLLTLFGKLHPLVLLRPLAMKATNVLEYLTHPNVGWTPGYFLRKLKDKFENLVALSHGVFGSGVVHNVDYPFPYRAARDSKK